MGKRYLCKKLITMKKLFTLFAAGALFATGAFAQLPTPFQVEPDAVKDLAEVDLSRNPKLEVIAIQSPNLKTVVIAVGSKPQFYFPTQSGEIVVRRVVNPDDPNAIWYQ